MSLEGGFDELPEFFRALANCDSSSVMCCSSAAKRWSRSSQCGHPTFFDFAMMANNVDQPRKFHQDRFMDRGRLPLSQLTPSAGKFALETTRVLFHHLLVLRLRHFVLAPSGKYSIEFIQKETHTIALGKVLYTDFLFPFEIASLILLIAIVGAIVLAKKRLKS